MKILFFLILCFSMTASFAAKTIVFGNIYDIAEPDILEEIKQRAEKVDWKSVYKKDPATWSAFASPLLPESLENKQREHTPIYTVEENIIDRNSNIIYPKGYEFNPLDYMMLPANIYIIGGTKKQIAWIKTQDTKNSMIITSGGDPIAMGKELNKPVFLVNDQLIKRLKIEVIPTMIKQTGNKLLLTEYLIKENIDAQN